MSNSVSALVPCGYCDKRPQIWWLKILNFILSGCSGGQKAAIKVLAGLQSLSGFWEDPSCLSQLLKLQVILVLQ
jgi:hypothetical protein